MLVILFGVTVIAVAAIYFLIVVVGLGLVFFGDEPVDNSQDLF